MDLATINKSREHFSQLKQDGFILSGNYEDSSWEISNEVIKSAFLHFRLDEVHYMQETAKLLNCTLSDYLQAMRIVITSRFGYSISTLQSDIAVMRNFADQLEVPTEYVSAQLLADLLALLPGNSTYRAEVQNRIDDISPLYSANRQQRKLAHYQSYLRFLDVLDQFWGSATDDERIFFFPVWFWFKITGVLPLRPTECVLTPRQCIRKEGDRFYLTVRRTRLKGKRQGNRYKIESDYDCKEYPIPAHLAKPIQDYISVTQGVYESDIDVLFCKVSQFSKIITPCDNDKHYTYANLSQCLSYFYRDVVQKKYGYDIVFDQDDLAEAEIERIHLGDTRHIAMIALAVSGGSPTICKELAGHDSITISSHYYTNLTEFLDVLGYERFRENKATMIKSFGIQINQQYPVENGYCQCKQVWNGDYSPCISAVNSDGVPGSCVVCRWYFPSKIQLPIKMPTSYIKDNHTDVSPKKAISLELQQTCTLLKQAVNQLRQGLGNTDTVSSILDRLSAQSQQYVQASAIERMLTEREVF